MYDAAHGNELRRHHLTVGPLRPERVQYQVALQRVIGQHQLEAVRERFQEFLVRGHLRFQRIRQFHVLLVAQVVSVREVVRLEVIPVVRVIQHGRNILRAILLRKTLWVVYVLVILDTTVLRILLVPEVRPEMHLVAFPPVVAKEVGVEDRVLRRVVVASAIKIIYEESDATHLVDVGGKVRPDTVLARLSVAATVVGQVGERAQRVGEAEVLEGGQSVGKRLEEKEREILRPVEIDA